MLLEGQKAAWQPPGWSLTWIPRLVCPPCSSSPRWSWRVPSSPVCPPPSSPLCPPPRKSLARRTRESLAPVRSSSFQREDRRREDREETREEARLTRNVVSWGRPGRETTMAIGLGSKGLFEYYVINFVFFVTPLNKTGILLTFARTTLNLIWIL